MIVAPIIPKAIYSMPWFVTISLCGTNPFRISVNCGEEINTSNTNIARTVNIKSTYNGFNLSETETHNK